MSESLVDLLLVRLGREEEKRKVLKLLITNLDLSVTEAESAVANSPSVIKEAVPMSEARIVQKDLYPYIDLLPRLDDEPDTVEDNNVSTPEPIEDELPLEEDVEMGEIEDFPEDEADLNDNSSQPAESETEEPLPDEESQEPLLEDYAQDHQANHKRVEEAKEEDELEADVLITSTTDEIVVSSRCHICGRSPANGEKLAPCRTCGDYTCRNCFDRVAHVCQKCASEGKTVDKAQSSYYKTEEDLEFDNEESEPIKDSKASFVLRIIGIILFICAVGYAFYYFDPLDLFGTNTEETDISDVEPVIHDSLLVEVDTTLVESPDSLGTTDVLPDSQITTHDSLPVLNEDSIDLDDPYNIFSLQLPEKFDVIENSTFAYRTRTPSSLRADILRDESEVLFNHIGNIAASIPLEIDDAALLLYEDSITIAVFAVLHSENMERRIGFVREVSIFLTDSKIHQLVLIYQENPYYEPVHYAVSRENFSELEGIFNPNQFQSMLGYYEGSQQFVSESILEWLSSSD